MSSCRHYFPRAQYSPDAVEGIAEFWRHHLERLNPQTSAHMIAKQIMQVKIQARIWHCSLSRWTDLHYSQGISTYWCNHHPDPLSIYWKYLYSALHRTAQLRFLVHLSLTTTQNILVQGSSMWYPWANMALLRDAQVFLESVWGQMELLSSLSSDWLCLFLRSASSAAAATQHKDLHCLIDSNAVCKLENRFK